MCLGAQNFSEYGGDDYEGWPAKLLYVRPTLGGERGANRGCAASAHGACLRHDCKPPNPLHYVNMTKHDTQLETIIDVSAWQREAERARRTDTRVLLQQYQASKLSQYNVYILHPFLLLNKKNVTEQCYLPACSSMASIRQSEQCR